VLNKARKPERFFVRPDCVPRTVSDLRELLLADRFRPPITERSSNGTSPGGLNPVLYCSITSCESYATQHTSTDSSRHPFFLQDTRSKILLRVSWKTMTSNLRHSPLGGYLSTAHTVRQVRASMHHCQLRRPMLHCLAFQPFLSASLSESGSARYAATFLFLLGYTISFIAYNNCRGQTLPRSTTHDACLLVFILR